MLRLFGLHGDSRQVSVRNSVDVSASSLRLYDELPSDVGTKKKSPASLPLILMVLKSGS